MQTTKPIRPKEVKDFYEILQISKDASEEVIKARFKAFAMQLHPDKGGTKADENRLKEISEAKTVLLNPAARARYNLDLRDYPIKMAKYEAELAEYEKFEAQKRARHAGKPTSSSPRTTSAKKTSQGSATKTKASGYTNVSSGPYAASANQSKAQTGPSQAKRTQGTTSNPKPGPTGSGATHQTPPKSGTQTNATPPKSGPMPPPPPPPKKPTTGTPTSSPSSSPHSRVARKNKQKQSSFAGVFFSTMATVLTISFIILWIINGISSCTANFNKPTTTTQVASEASKTATQVGSEKSGSAKRATTAENVPLKDLLKEQKSSQTVVAPRKTASIEPGAPSKEFYDLYKSAVSWNESPSRLTPWTLDNQQAKAYAIEWARQNNPEFEFYDVESIASVYRFRVEKENPEWKVGKVLDVTLEGQIDAKQIVDLAKSGNVDSCRNWELKPMPKSKIADKGIVDAVNSFGWVKGKRPNDKIQLNDKSAKEVLDLYLEFNFPHYEMHESGYITDPWAHEDKNALVEASVNYIYQNDFIIRFPQRMSKNDIINFVKDKKYHP